ncbi:hypothetical protein BKA67DRAFT_649703 [Truncatella angustata]|uniref:Uncharacterized protein n=1 Tax=Truncatella angustata TaxID=152316 RepID=A0A9P8UDR6_9PEZI|nr:uncharacterized protein BKA67DRAFT_649703 [Truncatella angustata]KAH6648056.1 hypothetical protein BKA67DRAFT_649703 [Truncatella angustata]
MCFMALSETSCCISSRLPLIWQPVYALWTTRQSRGDGPAALAALQFKGSYKILPNACPTLPDDNLHICSATTGTPPQSLTLRFTKEGAKIPVPKRAVKIFTQDHDPGIPVTGNFTFGVGLVMDSNAGIEEVAIGLLDLGDVRNLTASNYSTLPAAMARKAGTPDTPNAALFFGRIDTQKTMLGMPLTSLQTVSPSGSDNIPFSTDPLEIDIRLGFPTINLPSAIIHQIYGILEIRYPKTFDNAPWIPCDMASSKEANVDCRARGLGKGCSTYVICCDGG